LPIFAKHFLSAKQGLIFKEQTRKGEAFHPGERERTTRPQPLAAKRDCVKKLQGTNLVSLKKTCRDTRSPMNW